MKAFFHVRPFLFVASILGIFLNTVSAQQIDVNGILKKFDQYQLQAFQEKIYAHLDRPSYLTGETVWFKIYLTDASSHLPSDVSKVAYIDFVDRTNTSVLQAKVEMKNGFGSGSLYLPATLNSGNYIVRAYTHWMKNSSAEFYFHKTISIINTFRAPEGDTQTNTATHDAQFFPEGGNLLAGVKNNVAFRVIDANAMGIDFDGAVFNEQNDTISKFTPYKFGIGRFNFIPKENQRYHAVIRDRAGKTLAFQLPPVLSNGYSMEVADNGSSQIKIKVNALLPDSTAIKGAYLLIHSRNVVVHASFRMLANGSTTFSVNTRDLKDGISHITIFDASKNPVGERLYFKQPMNNLTLTIRPDQIQYGTRKPVKVDLTSTVKEAAIESNLSISVFKIDSISTFTGNIKNYFWLTSDLKGTIESPAFYFQSTPEAKEAIDNLMLTHGWRRFEWNGVMNSKKKIANFIPEYRGHIIQGTVVSKDGSAASGIKAYLSTPGKAVRFYPSQSNEKGDVLFEIQNLNGYSKIYVQTNPKIDSLHKVTIKLPFSTQFAVRPIPAFKLFPSLKDALIERSIAMQVQDVYFTNEDEKVKTKIDTTSFFGKADETYLLDAFTRFPVMEEVMREYVKGIFVRKRKDEFHFIVLDNVRKDAFRDTPLMLLDGVPIFDEDEIMSINPLKVKKIEVMTKKWYLGSMNFSGIVSLSTYEGDLGGFQLNPKGVTLNYEGLQAQREFYSPKYETQKQRESRLPDQRYLLFWNPTIDIGKDGHQLLEFYTSDVQGEYKIIVEGMTKNGLMGNTTATFKVSDSSN
ncbi:MAG: hypothetical protein ACKVOQ_03945 [Cyclobacteriaceae bacterium]